MHYIASYVKRAWPRSAIYISNIIFAFHGALIIFINSSFLEEIIDTETVGLLFTTGSALALIIFLNAPKILDYFGTYKTATGLFVIEFLSVLGLALVREPTIIIFLFLVYFVTWPFILYTFDVFLEATQKTESTTGGARASFLTFSNLAFVISPTIAGLILGVDNNYTRVYLISSLFIIPLYIIFKKAFSKNFTEPDHKENRIVNTIKEVTRRPNIFNIVMAQGILRFFFAWMIIYAPIHLHNNIGFDWPEIGLMFTFMLLPYIILEIPAGYLADRKYGEKELLILGFIILSGSTMSLAFITSPVFIVWATLLFLTRVGASFVEVMTETYFFKKVSKDDANLISFFRITQPFSFVIAPIIASVALLFIDLRLSFLILGILVLTGIFFALRIEDTR